MTTLLILSHVLVSLAGIAAGLLVVVGFLTQRSSARTTTIFLVTTIITSASGFILPAARFLPSHAVGILSLLVLPLVLYARTRQRSEGGWRTVFVIGSVVALYLNVFVAVVQSFLKIPALKALAPTQTEPPFKLTQLAVLLLFVALGIAASWRSRRATATRDTRLPSLP